MAGQVHLERDGDIAVLVIDNPPVNAGSHAVRKALLAAIAAVEDDDSLTGAVLIGAGRSFISGSDLREFDLPLDPPQMPQVIAAIEASGKPFVAALHGAALGGGYELALGCDARIAAPGTVVGLPETALGIIPGAGGTQKLPRLVGRPEAIRLIAGAVRVPAERALTLGMIDAVAEGDLLAEAVAMARAMARTKRRIIDCPVPEAEGLEEAVTKASARARPHVLAAIAHVRAAGTISAAEGLAAERATFQELRTAPEARALRHIFFAEREAARGHPDRSARPLPIARLGVIGSGTMGAGIATAILQAGRPVVLVDTDAEALARGIARIDDALAGAVKRGKMGATAAHDARARLEAGTDLAALAPCDLVIEAVFEDLGVKQALFARLDTVLRSDAVLATNTSYLDIDRMADAITNPERVIGLHFFSPAHVMKLLEIVRATHSSDAAMATGLSVAKMLGKQPVEAANGFGFIGNRIYAAYRLACEFMLEDGALPHQVDAALEDFGFAMGPFKVADLSGLDIAWNMRSAQVAMRDPADRYVTIPDQLCEAGRFGRKTGAGYFRYDGDAPARDPEVEALILAASETKGIIRQPLAPDAIVLRAMAAIVNEAALVMQDGIALRASDIDVVLVNGYGFPRWRGGPGALGARAGCGQADRELRRLCRHGGPWAARGRSAATGYRGGNQAMTNPQQALAALWAPDSVAIVGASADPTKTGGRPVAYLRKHGFSGAIWPVNPRVAEIDGLPCYPSIADLPGAPDVAIVLLGVERAEGAVRDLSARGCKLAIVLASGYSETGEEGRARQDALRQAAGDMRLLGPNTIGAMDLSRGIVLSASGAAEPGRHSRRRHIGRVAKRGHPGCAAVARRGTRHRVSPPCLDRERGGSRYRRPDRRLRRRSRHPRHRRLCRRHPLCRPVPRRSLGRARCRQAAGGLQCWALGTGRARRCLAYRGDGGRGSRLRRAVPSGWRGKGADIFRSSGPARDAGKWKAANGQAHRHPDLHRGCGQSCG